MLAGSTTCSCARAATRASRLDRELTNAAQVEARALSAYFERAATAISLAAADPDLAPDSTPARGASGRAERRRIERSLAYIARIYPRGSIGRISFVDACGTELARLEGGAAVSPRRLVARRAARALLPPRRCACAVPRRSRPRRISPTRSGQWVISSSAPVGARGGRPSGLVRFELRLESFRLVAAQLVPEHDTPRRRPPQRQDGPEQQARRDAARAARLLRRQARRALRRRRRRRGVSRTCATRAATWSGARPTAASGTCRRTRTTGPSWSPPTRPRSCSRATR